MVGVVVMEVTGIGQDGGGRRGGTVCVQTTSPAPITQNSPKQQARVGHTAFPTNPAPSQHPQKNPAPSQHPPTLPLWNALCALSACTALSFGR